MLRRHLLAVLALAACLSACGSSSSWPTTVGSQVHLSTSQLELVFECTEPFAETYMVFGGLSMDRSDAVSKITIVGLSMADAQPIFSRYPDFHKCASPGAASAQSKIRQMDIVPANAGVLAMLQETLERHEASIGGDRVCVKLHGSMVTIASATAEGTDVTSQLPPQLMHEYFFVQGAEIVDARNALVL